VPPMELEISRQLLRKVVESLYSKRHSPVPGAQVKARLIEEAEATGGTFSERELGFTGFLEFVKSAPGIAVQIRPGSDMLLAPATATDTLSAFAEPLPLVRRDFWRAFIEFPVVGVVRIYDPDEDKIFYDASPETRKGIAIEPVTRDEHIAWRRTFSEEQPEPTHSELLNCLGRAGSSVFTDFARRLRENPAIMQAWNRYLQKKITDRIAEWAQHHGVPEDRWRGVSSKWLGGVSQRDGLRLNAQPIGQRAELYKFLDDLPIEDLLQLRVPLDWVLKVMRNNR
jgi:hypothetical protein